MGDRGLFDALGAERAQLKGLKHFQLETGFKGCMGDMGLVDALGAERAQLKGLKHF